MAKTAARTARKPAKAGKTGKAKASGGRAAKAKEDGPEVDDQTILLDPDDVEIPPPGHFLHDPDGEGKPPSKETITSIIKVGVLQNIIVWRDGKKNYVVVGRDRVRHAREAKKIQVEQGAKNTIRLKCTVRRGSEAYLISLMGIENAHRRRPDPYKQAQIMQRMLDHGSSYDDLKVTFKMGEKTIQRRLNLLNLTNKGQKALRKGLITATEAERLSTKEREKQDEIVRKVEEAAERAAETGEKVVVQEIATDRTKGRRLVAAVCEDDLLSDEVRAGMLWVIGHIDDAEACQRIEGFEMALDRINGGGCEAEKAKLKERGVKGPASPVKAGQALGQLIGSA